MRKRKPDRLGGLNTSLHQGECNQIEAYFHTDRDTFCDALTLLTIGGSSRTARVKETNEDHIDKSIPFAELAFRETRRETPRPAGDRCHDRRFWPFDGRSILSVITESGT